MLQVIGISFNLIIIRVDKGIAIGDRFSIKWRRSSISLHYRSTQDIELEHGITPVASAVAIKMSLDIAREETVPPFASTSKVTMCEEANQV